MRPTEGILNKKSLNNFLKRLKKNGSKFSYRKVQNKSRKVYEANITVFDALKKSDSDPNGKFFLERYLAAHAIMISFEGVPAVYFNSLFGKANDEAKYVITGNNRDVNRYKWNYKNITKKLSDKNSKQSIFYQNLGKLLEIKRKQKAFHPNAKRLNINLGSKLFCFKRISLDKKQTIMSITNCSSVDQHPKLDKKYNKWKNIINPQNRSHTLKPFETMWLSNI
jgi:sucrose phosphorylase